MARLNHIDVRQRSEIARAAGRVRGFTLIEAVVVMSIVAIMVGLAGPYLRDLILAQRVKNASFDVFSTITFARSEAISRNSTVSITPSGGNWSNGWSVVEDAGGTTLRTQNAVANVTISGPTNVVYNGTGRLNAALSNPFSLTGTGVLAANSRCIRIDPSGRPRVASGTCS